MLRRLLKIRVEMSLLTLLMLLASPVAGIFAYGVVVEHQTRSLTLEVQRDIANLQKQLTEG
jgi:hypothetical protein